IISVPVPTNCTVTVHDTLPIGLTAIAICGFGLSCTLGTLTCTRSDALAASASYPPVLLNVNVATDAAASVTNAAAVSGGSELNTSNDTVSDPTIVIKQSTPGIITTVAGNGDFDFAGDGG